MQKNPNNYAKDLYSVPWDWLIGEFTSRMQNGSATIFAGSGLSQDANLPLWNDLVRDMKRQMETEDSHKPADGYDEAHTFSQHNNNRPSLINILTRHITGNEQPTENHRIITRLPLRTVWTSNFDLLFENAYREAGKTLTSIRRDEDLVISRTEDVKLYKIHGCITIPERIVIDGLDLHYYEKYYPIMSDVFLSSLAKETFLFLGFSFYDRHIYEFFGRLKQRYAGNLRNHFAVLKCPDKEEEMKEFYLFVNRLGSYGLKILIVDNYYEVTRLLKEIEMAYIRKNIFISGSFYKNFLTKHVNGSIEFKYEKREKDFPEKDSFYHTDVVPTLKKNLTKKFPYTDNTVSIFNQVLAAIGQGLMKNGMNIYSGYGFGVCNELLEGGVSKVINENKTYHSMTDRLKIFPLPEKWKVETIQNSFYREVMLGASGVKLVFRGSTYSSDYMSGTFKEYNIAKGLSNLMLVEEETYLYELKAIVRSFMTRQESGKKENAIEDARRAIGRIYLKQQKAINYQFETIIEMFYRTVYEQWKLVIRSMDGYAKRMEIFIDAFKDDPEFGSIQEAWNVIYKDLQKYSSSRLMKFYALFEKPHLEISEMIPVTEGDIDEVMLKIKALRKKIGDLQRPGTQYILREQKARANCMALIKLIQGDYKYSVITRLLERFNEVETKCILKVYKGDEILINLEQEYEAIFDEIQGLKKKFETERSIDRYSKEYLLKIQLDYLLTLTENPDKDEQTQENILGRVFYDDFEKHKKNIYSRFITKDLEELENLKLKPDDIEYESDFEYAFDKCTVIKIQVYKVFLVLADVIGGLQRVKADYETTLIAEKVNDNNRIKESIYRNPGKSPVPEPDSNENDLDPFFLNPNKFERYLNFHKGYIETYTYQVEILKEMVSIKKAIKIMLGILGEDKGNNAKTKTDEKDRYTYDPAQLKVAFNHNTELIEISVQTLRDMEREYNKNNDNFRSQPSRSATIILPLACFGGMALKIWKEERVRFRYLCYQEKSFSKDERNGLMDCYDRLYSCDFEKTINEYDKQALLVKNLVEDLFHIIDAFQKTHKVGGRKSKV